jgi:parafibromin
MHLFNEHILKKEENPTESDSVQSQSKSISNDRNKENVKYPIIIVPNAATSLLSIFNVEDYLVNGRFVTTQEKKNHGATRECPLRIKKTNEYGTKTYDVIDNPLSLTDEDWNRVVAVFVTGQEWQFKTWKWKTAVELFKNVLGVFVNFEGHTILPTVQSWNCKILKVLK